jgi:hypothetical protein
LEPRVKISKAIQIHYAIFFICHFFHLVSLFYAIQGYLSSYFFHIDMQKAKNDNNWHILAKNVHLWEMLRSRVKALAGPLVLQVFQGLRQQDSFKHCKIIFLTLPEPCYILRLNIDRKVADKLN